VTNWMNEQLLIKIMERLTGFTAKGVHNTEAGNNSIGMIPIEGLQVIEVNVAGSTLVHLQSPRHSAGVYFHIQMWWGNGNIVKYTCYFNSRKYTMNLPHTLKIQDLLQ